VIIRLLIAALLAFSMSGCGTKSALLLPDGKPSPRDQKDPSQPPGPISR
jgi:predicted small lipoprotein YifL